MDRSRSWPESCLVRQCGHSNNDHTHCIGILVLMSSSQYIHDLIFPSAFLLMLKGELVPTRESPYFDRTCLRSVVSSDVTSCWYVLDIPRTIVAATLIRSNSAVFVCVIFLQSRVPPPTEVEFLLARWMNRFKCDATTMIMAMAKADVNTAIDRRERSINS
jgi:hypothetical protein